MVAPLIAAAARTGGAAAAKKIATKTTITRTTTGEARVIQNARAAKNKEPLQRATPFTRPTAGRGTNALPKKPATGDYLKGLNAGRNAYLAANNPKGDNDNERSPRKTLAANDNESLPKERPPLASRVQGERITPLQGAQSSSLGTEPLSGQGATENQREDENSEQEEQEKIRQAQARTQRLRQAGNVGKLTLDEGFASEQDKAKKHKPHLILYIPAFSVAIFKDLLDWVGIGSLPAIGTVITIVCSALIFILLLLFKANKNLADSHFLLKLLIIGLATLSP
jgi:hypothetical protein